MRVRTHGRFVRAAIAAALWAGAAASPPDGPVRAVAASGAAGRAGGPEVVATPPPDTVRLVDDAGRVLLLTVPARRIVSLVPALTETLFAIGAGDRVVGRTRFDRHPPAVRRVPDVGDGIRPSAETIRALEPDVVVLFAGPDNQGVAEELERAGVRPLAVRHNTLGDLERNVSRLGRLTGCTAGAEALLRAIRAGMRRVARATADRPRRAVYYDVWPAPPITVGSGSYLDSLLTLAGARNVFGDLSDPSPQVGLEAIVARNPDIVVWPAGAGSSATAPPPRERPGWEALRAVRRGGVRRVDGELVHRLGPRVAEAAAELAAAIHPELAGRLRPKAGARPPGREAGGWAAAGAACGAGR